MPRTAVGDADPTGDADALGWDDGATVRGAGGGEDGVAVPAEGAAVAMGDAAAGDAVELCSGAAALLAMAPVDDAAKAAAPSARSATSATIGRIGIGRPSGKRSRQFGQNPETGVVT